MSDAVGYLREEHPEAYALAAWTRDAVLAADPDLGERVLRGWRGVGFRHPEAGYVCAIFPEASRVELLFEHGASLGDPRLVGGGSQTCVLPIDAADAETRTAVLELVQQAVAAALLRRW